MLTAGHASEGRRALPRPAAAPVDVRRRVIFSGIRFRHLLDENTASGMGDEDDRSTGRFLRLARTRELQEQLSSMREDIILETQWLLVCDECMVAPGEDPRVRTGRRQQIQRPVHLDSLPRLGVCDVSQV